MRRRLRPELVVALGAASLLALATTATTAQAATQRFAFLIAAHDGGEGLPPLRYAGRDAGRLADVLVDVGGFARADVLSVVDGAADDVRATFDALDARVRDARGRGDEVVVVVYYSGHAADDRLRLGTTTLPMAELRARLQATGGDVRLAFVDSCGAGAITRTKGATLAPPFVVKVDEDLAARGQVIIASSSASEVSQESDEIQGSFFTHYLATGLRGDADRDRDGRVTLDEAYAYAYGRTVAATANTRAGAQHPTYAFDLQGAGDVVLTTPGGADVVVQFPDALEGRYFVVDLERQLFVAEVDKQKGGTSTIALPRGQYAIKKRLDSHLLMTRVQARQKGTIVVDDAAMDRVSFADDFAKGSPVAVSASVTRALGFSLAVGAGVHGVVDPARAVAGGNDGGLFPTTPLVTVDARVHGLLNRDLDLAIDIGVGRVTSDRVVDGGTLGVLTFPTEVTQVQAGAAVLWLLPLRDWTNGLVGDDDDDDDDAGLRVDLGPRVAGYHFTHAFIGDVRPVGVAQQTYLAFSPGVQVDVGWSPVGFAHLEVGARAHWLPYTVDELRHLGVVEGFASMWLDL
jgi:hypothetical protein